MLLDIDLPDLHEITNALIDYKYFMLERNPDPVKEARLERLISHFQTILDQEAMNGQGKN